MHFHLHVGRHIEPPMGMFELDAGNEIAERIRLVSPREDRG
jgi:hypothetical protein